MYRTILNKIFKTNNYILFDTGNEGIAKLLIENGIELNTLNKFNNTALIIAIDEGIHSKS